MLDVVTSQIHQMPEQWAYDELTARISNRAKEAGVEKPLRERLDPEQHAGPRELAPGAAPTGATAAAAVGVLSGAEGRGDAELGSVLAPAFEGLRHGDLVGPFQVGAHRHAHGDARHLHAQGLQEAREVDGGGLAFHGGAGGQDDLLHPPRRTRSSRPAIFSSSGPTPCSGASEPCSTW